MIRFLYSRTVIVAASAIVVMLNVLHPFLHAFEGGALDASLVYMNVWAGFALNEGGYDV